MSLNRQLEEETVLDGIRYVRVPSEPRFAVSSCGKVMGRTGRILKLRSNGKYKTVAVSTPRSANYYVHRLVAEVFLGPSELCVNHIDGDRDNNDVSNLEYVTHAQNTAHAIATGLVTNLPKKGERGFQCAS